MACTYPSPAETAARKRRAPTHTMAEASSSRLTTNRTGENTVAGSSFRAALYALSLSAQKIQRVRSGCSLRAMMPRSRGWKTRRSQRGCVRPASVSWSPRSPTSAPIIEMLLLEPHKHAHDLLREIPGAPHAGELGSRPHRREPDVELLAAPRKVSELPLPVAAQVDAEHPTAGHAPDEPADAPGGVLHLHPAGPAATTLREHEHRFAPAQQPCQPREHVSHVPAAAPTRDRHALHQVDQHARYRGGGEVAPLRHVPRQRRVVQQEPRGRSQRPGDERRVDHGEMVRAHEQRSVTGPSERPVLAPGGREAVDPPS